jgi:transcriptional regulator with XRE-family HTH domain
MSIGYDPVLSEGREGMKDLASYIEAAKKRNGLTSERQLAKALGISPSPFNGMVHGHYMPSDATMLRLAELAGVDPCVALLDLNAWRAKDPNVKRVYGELGKRLAHVAKMTGGGLGIAAFLATSTPTKPADAGETMARVASVETIHYATSGLIARLRRLLDRLLGRRPHHPSYVPA